MMVKAERFKLLSGSTLINHPEDKTAPPLSSTCDPFEPNYCRGIYFSAPDNTWYSHWRPADSSDIHIEGFAVADFMESANHDVTAAMAFARARALQSRQDAVSVMIPQREAMFSEIEPSPPQQLQAPFAPSLTGIVVAAAVPSTKSMKVNCHLSDMRSEIRSANQSTITEGPLPCRMTPVEPPRLITSEPLQFPHRRSTTNRAVAPLPSIVAPILSPDTASPRHQTGIPHPTPPPIKPESVSPFCV